jgi:amino acid transporter
MFLLFNQANSFIVQAFPEHAGGIVAAFSALLAALIAGMIVLYAISAILHLEEADRAKTMIMRKFFRR